MSKRATAVVGVGPGRSTYRTSGASTLLVAISVGAACCTGGCKSKAEQCNALVGTLERTDGLMWPPAGSSRPTSDAYFDALVAAKRDLAALSLSDEHLLALRDNEVSKLEDFIFSQRDIEESQVPSDLDKAVERRTWVLKGQAENANKLSLYCGRTLALPARLPKGDVRPAPAETAGSASPDTASWMTFHHPSLPFEAQYFSPPEVGERTGPSSVTNSAIANDERRMFSAAHIVLRSLPHYDCTVILEAHLQGKQDRFNCSRQKESTSTLDGRPTLEATLSCADGVTMLKRIGCVARPADQIVVLFDVEAIYLRDWDAAEARRFADSAKLRER